MDPEKPPCPTHGARNVATIRGSNGVGKWFRCSYGDFQTFVSREVASFGEVLAMDIWEKILKSLDNLGEIISTGGDDMTVRAKKEIDELGQIIAMEKKK
jgi:hypothetical protein